MQLSAPHVQSVIPKSNSLVFFFPPLFFISVIKEILNVSIVLLQPSDFMSMVKTSSQDFFR